MHALQHVRDEQTYRCGEALPCELVSRRALTCCSPIEVHYYSGQRAPVCFHCGTEDNIMNEYDPYIEDLLEKFSKVRPICKICHEQGKEAKTWGQKFFTKKQKRC